MAEVKTSVVPSLNGLNCKILFQPLPPPEPIPSNLQNHSLQKFLLASWVMVLSKLTGNVVFMPSNFNDYATSRKYRIKMNSIDKDWGGGRRTILDFEKRLVNALGDAKLNNNNVSKFLEWFQEAIKYFNHDDNSGAIMITSIYKD